MSEKNMHNFIISKWARLRFIVNGNCSGDDIFMKGYTYKERCRVLCQGQGDNIECGYCVASGGQCSTDITSSLKYFNVYLHVQHSLSRIHLMLFYWFSHMQFTIDIVYYVIIT